MHEPFCDLTFASLTLIAGIPWRDHVRDRLSGAWQPGTESQAPLKEQATLHKLGSAH